MAVSQNLFLEREAGTVSSQAQLHLILREPVLLVSKVVEVEAFRVVTGEVPEEAVAVLSRAEARADRPAHDAEAVDRADRRPGVLLPAKCDVGARATVPRVFERNSLVVVDHQLGDLTVLAEVPWLLKRCAILEGGGNNERREKSNSGVKYIYGEEDST